MENIYIKDRTENIIRLREEIRDGEIGQLKKWTTIESR